MSALHSIDRDKAALLAAVKSEPDDDLPRLAYADWLEENGETAQAKYIRWSLLKRHTHPVPRVHYRQWFRPWWSGRSCFYHCASMKLMVARRGNEPANHFYVRRGFVESVYCSIDQWIAPDGMSSIVREQPVTIARLTDRCPVKQEGGGWAWRYAPSGDLTAHHLADIPNMLPWAVYWAMPGDLGKRTAVYGSEQLALDAVSASLLSIAGK